MTSSSSEQDWRTNSDQYRKAGGDQYRRAGPSNHRMRRFPCVKRLADQQAINLGIGIRNINLSIPNLSDTKFEDILKGKGETSIHLMVVENCYEKKYEISCDLHYIAGEWYIINHNHDGKTIPSVDGKVFSSVLNPTTRVSNFPKLIFAITKKHGLKNQTNMVGES